LLTLKDGHNWGGDFSQYIINAINLNHHRPFNSGIMLENPFNYPPGLAFILSPIIKNFGVNFKALKMINVVFWYASIFLLYKIAIKRFRKDLAWWCCLTLAVSSDFFVFKQNILSDIPFVFFITLAIFLAEEYSWTSKWTHFILYLVVISFAFLLRSVGVILFAASFVYIGFVMKKWDKAVWVLVALALAWGFQVSLCGLQSGFFGQPLHNPVQFFSSVLQRNSIPFRTFLWFFAPGQTVLTERIFLFMEKVMIWVAPVLYVVIIVRFAQASRQKTLTLLDMFMFFYLVPMFLWSGFLADAKALTRLTWPVGGFALIYALRFFIFLIESIAERMKKKIDPGYVVRLGKGFLFLLIFLNFFNLSSSFRFNDDVLFKKENQEMFKWVKQNVKENEHYMCWQARVVALMTGRVGAVPYNPQLTESFPDRVTRLHISYLVMVKSVDQLLIQMMNNSGGWATPIWQNQDYQVFKVNE
jgi:hypothetical protein